MTLEKQFDLKPFENNGDFNHDLEVVKALFQETQKKLYCTQLENVEITGQVEELQNCLDGVFFIGLIDPEFNFTVEWVGNSLERFFNVKRTVFLKDWQAILDEVNSSMHAKIKDVLTCPSQFPNKQSLIFPLLESADKQTRYFNLVVKKKHENEKLRVFCVISDVTELVQMQKTAESNDRAKSAFLATVSHELKTPLNAIIGFSNYLRNCLHDRPALQKDVDNIIFASRSLNVVLNDILDFSTIRANGLQLDKEPFCLHDFVMSLIRLNRSQAKQKGLDLQYSCGIPKDYYVIGDENRLRQVVQNLITNAITFTDNGFVEVNVTAGKLDDKTVPVQIDVIDTGLGLSKYELSRVFKPFTQAFPEIHKLYGGSGLGLTIASELIGCMNGDLSASSSAGLGSKFTVKLMMERSELAASKTMPITLVNHQMIKPIHILAVDDHFMNLKLLSKVLKKAGHHIQLAESGYDAVSMAEKHLFDLILMDIDMPGIDGFETTEKIRKLNSPSKHAHICAVTSFIDLSTIRYSVRVGMNSHLPKPLDFNKLNELVSEINRIEVGL